MKERSEMDEAKDRARSAWEQARTRMEARFSSEREVSSCGAERMEPQTVVISRVSFGCVFDFVALASGPAQA